MRRAYSKLISELRPETHPTHFQKLHEAYELVLAIVDGGGANILFPGSGPLFDFDNKPSVGSRGNAGSGSADEVTAETVWRQYSEAPGIDAFHAAKRLSESAGASAEVFLMLYWMLRLHPDIAPSEDRLPWLQRGLKRHPQDGRFVDLLTAELRADSLLCVDEQTRDIAAQIVRPDSLARYLSVRWDGIGRYSAWQGLDDEINQARGLFGLEQSEAWVRLLITAYEIVSFSTNPSGQRLMDKVKQEILSFRDLELTLSEDLESLDLWQLFRMQRAKEHRNEIVHFVTRQQYADPTETRVAVLEVIYRWIDRPRVGLKL